MTGEDERSDDSWRERKLPTSVGERIKEKRGGVVLKALADLSDILISRVELAVVAS